MSKYYSVDRIEGDRVVCVDGKEIVSIPRSELPFSFSEGDVLVFENNTYRLDREETARRREEVRNLLEDLF